MKNFTLILSILGLVAESFAAVDLVTLPRRDRTQLTIYNSEDITMVREHRMLTVKKGINRIQFSWANTLIDPTSIEFRLLDHQDQVDLIDTTFPSGRNDALQWNIQSELDGKIPVEIRYFTSGITWTADYVGIANESETELDVTGYVRVFNQSGELYDHAETRMVVGTINLVEKIADLARLPPPDEGEKKNVYHRLNKGLRMEAQKELVTAFAFAETARESDPIKEDKKKVVKQGLSEYFLFAIEGREDIKHGEPKRLVSMDVKSVPLDVLYKLSDRTGGTRFSKFYRFKNEEILDEKKRTAMENLGLSPLPNGEVRLFSEYANKDLAYVGGTQVKYVPIGDRVEVDVGLDHDLTMTRGLKDQTIRNVVTRQYKRRLNNTFVLYYDLVDYDETFHYEEEIVSGKPGLAKAEIERRFEDNVVLWGNGPKPDDWDSNAVGAYVDLHEHEGKIEKVDANHVKYFLDLKPGQKQFVQYSVTYKRRKAGPEFNQEKKREPIR